MPLSDLRTRLQRLGVHQGPRELVTPLPPTAPPANLPGRAITSRLGAYQLIENFYPLDHQHGPLALRDALKRDTTIAARLAKDDALREADLRRVAFLDTETTGLAGGAGTLAFLVGVGVYTAKHFVLRQYFLSDPNDEEALLTALVSDLAPYTAWVTFNGKAFDLPLLEARLTLNAQRGALGRRPHLDLLMPARRLYRGRLPSCSLGTLEKEVLQITREDEDVSGALIPQMYQDYLRTRDASEMRRVIYHNEIDILSMVTLMGHVLDVFSTEIRSQKPREAVSGRKSEVKRNDQKSSEAGKALQAADWLRLGRWHDDQGRHQEAEIAYQKALQGKLSLEDRVDGIRRLTELFKRLNRQTEAKPWWEQWASFSVDTLEPFIELAKYYEWYAKDNARALPWAEKALQVVASWPRGWQRTEAREAVEKRIRRLKKKSEK